MIRTDPWQLQDFDIFCPRFRFSFAGTELHKDAFNKFVKLWQQFKGAILFMSFHMRVLRFGGTESRCPGCSWAPCMFFVIPNEYIGRSLRSTATMYESDCKYLPKHQRTLVHHAIPIEMILVIELEVLIELY